MTFEEFTQINEIKNILIIFPHPDDESFTTGGLIQLAKKYNIKVNLLCLTDGDYGYSKIEKGEKLGNERKKELKNASNILGIDNLIIEKLNDGFLKDSIEELDETIKKYISEIQPDLIITYDPTGSTGHPDHIISSKIIFENCKINNLNLLYYLPISVFGKYKINNNQKLESSFKVQNILNFKKMKAFFSHKSQVDQMKFLDKILLRIFIMFSTEKYHIVDLSNQYVFKFKHFEFR